MKSIYDKYPQALVFITKKLKSNPKFSDTQVKNGEQFDRLTYYDYNAIELEKLIEQIDKECTTNPSFITKILWALQRSN